MSEPTYPHCEHCRVQSPEHSKYVNHAKPCRFDDCEGTQPAAPQPAPEVTAGAEVAEVLRELIELQDSAASGFAFSGRYIKLRTRALEALAATGRDEITLGLLEANEGLGEAQCRIAVAAGLPRASSADQVVARVGDLSSVLNELVATRRETEDDGWSLDRDICWDRVMGNAYAVVDAMAATGARAAGGETELWDAITADDGFRSAVRMADPEYGVDSSIVNQIASEVVRVVDAFYAAAPPAPAAPGVAELLAECRERIEIYEYAGIPCHEVVRWLAPGGADGDDG